MELWILFGVFTLLMLVGTPIAFCLGIASFATVLYLGLPPLVVFQRLNSGMSVFTLMAIPFFIYRRRPDGARRHRAAASSPSPARWSATSAAGSARSTSPPPPSSAASPARRWPKPPRSAA